MRTGRVAVSGLLIAALTGCSVGGASDGDQGSSAPGGTAGETGYASSDEALADLAEMYEIQDPPVVEPIRHITPAESKTLIDECMTDRGWPVVDGHIQFTSEQRDSLNMDSYICAAQYPIRPEYLQPLDGAAWGRIYDYWVNEALPCLESEGLTVNEPPSRETFVERRAWTPDSDQVRDQVRDRVRQGEYPDIEHVFTEVCPVSPPEEVQLGS